MKKMQVNTDSFLYENIETFYKITQYLRLYIQELLNGGIDEKVFENINKISREETFKLSQEIINKLGINLNILELNNTGRIKIIHVNQNNIDFSNNNSLRKNIIGRTYNGKEKYITTTFSGLNIDVPLLVHEAVHYSNQNKINTENSHNFSEALSLFSEYISVEYLKDNGYVNNLYPIMIRLKDTLSKIEKIIGNLTAIYIYKLTGTITSDSFKKIFPSENENGYYELIKKIKLEENSKVDIYFEFRYIFGTMLSIYMYNKYKKDPKFISKLSKLNNNLNQNYETSLSYIDLTPSDIENLQKIKKSMDELKTEFMYNNIKL